MKKSFIALAVAGAVAAPMTANAVDVSYSGTVGLDLYLNEKTEDGARTTRDHDANIQTNDIRFKVSATEDVGFAQAFGSLRLDLDGPNGSAVTADNIAVGLKGAFGTVTLGTATDYAEQGQLANDLILGSGTAGALNEPSVSLSYGLPDVAPGLTAGINVLNTTHGAGLDATTDAGVKATAVDSVKSGYGFGASYEVDLADAGSLKVGFGTNQATNTNRVNVNNSIADYQDIEAKYQSVGAKYSIAGVSLAVAQQSVTGIDVTTKAAFAGAGKTESEDITSTDIQLGYDGGPVSVYVATSTAENLYSGANEVMDDSKDTVDRNLETKVTRVNASYKLSDNIIVSARNQNKKATGKTAADAAVKMNDYKENFTRVGLTVNF